jgi:hypothetical protein
MLQPLMFLVLGTLMALWPGRWALGSATKRARRLREIDEGSAEKHFEERRELTEYAPTPRFLLLWRIMGALIAVVATGVLIARAGIAG